MLGVQKVCIEVSNQGPGWKLGPVCATAVSGKAFWLHTHYRVHGLNSCLGGLNPGI